MIAGTLFETYQNSKHKPDCKSDPGSLREFHHEIDVDKDAEHWEPRNKRDLEAQPLIRDGLTAEADHGDQQKQEDDDRYDVLRDTGRNQDHDHGKHRAEDHRSQGEE